MPRGAGRGIVEVLTRNISVHRLLARIKKYEEFRRLQAALGREGRYFVSGTTALLDGDWATAIDHLSRCGDAPEALFNLGLAWQAAGEPVRARTLFRRVESVDPWLFGSHVEPAGLPLRVAYLLPHVANTGGMRVIAEQMKGLLARGHEVWGYFPSYPGVVPDSAMAEVRDRLIGVPAERPFPQCLPPSAVAVAAFWDVIADAFLLPGAVPVYLAQGDSWVFEPESSPGAEIGVMRDMHLLPVCLVAVSHFLSSAMARLCGRRATVINPGIDLEHFESGPEGRSLANRPIRVVLVAPDGPGLEFKGVGDVIQALEDLRSRGYGFEALWITPQAPRRVFPGEVIVNPTRPQLARLLRGADVLVCGSHYEAFPLPPLEAMAAGTAVVSTRNGGVEEYAVDGWNCLLVPPRDPAALARALARLLTDEALRSALAARGRETARRFTWDRSVDALEAWLLERTSGPRPVTYPGSWLGGWGGGCR